MNCPEKITVKSTEITEVKCKENFSFWEKELNIQNDWNLGELNKFSENILTCHTTAYENLSVIFFDSRSNNQYRPALTGLLSLEIRNKRKGKETIPDDSAPHMKDSISLGHHIFLFAYHNVHNPYHRYEDQIPVKPVGFFIKKNTEIFACVHGSPCDVTTKNDEIDKYRSSYLDKFYLIPGDLRRLKPYQIFVSKYLNNNFWFYYGNPIDWKKEKGYGTNLFKSAGEFRYLDSISPDNIESVLWPVWKDDEQTENENLELYFKFRENYPNIFRIQYNRDKHKNNWPLALVEASYYSQRHFVDFGCFEGHADIAQAKIENKYGIFNNTHS